MSYKVEWEKELWRREQLGITDLPEPRPHLDHILIDLPAGIAHIAGPATKEEKALHDRIASKKADLQRSVPLLWGALTREWIPLKARTTSGT